MRAIILAAGFGSRLVSVTQGAPKVMTVIAGEPLIRRSARLLAEVGVREVVVVVGYKADEIRAELMTSSPIPVRFVENPRYAEVQTFYSLMLARPYVEDEPFLKLNGDVIFHPEILRRLIDADAPLGLAVDDRVKLDEEAMKVELGDDGRVLRIGKQLKVSTSYGESIGIERLDPPYASRIFDHLEAAAAQGETKLYYEDVFQRAIDAEGLPFRPVGIGGLPWTEIDDEKDYARAIALFEGRELGSHRAVPATSTGHRIVGRAVPMA